MSMSVAVVALETPVATFVEIDVVEDDGDFGSDKHALKVDASRGRESRQGIRGPKQVTHVFASQELQIGGARLSELEVR
jgi:hypothetical protein